MVITRETLNLIKSGIDFIDKPQAKAAKPYWSKLAPAVDTKEGFYRLKVITGFKEMPMHIPGSSVRSISKQSLADVEIPPFLFAFAVDVEMLAKDDDVYGEIAQLPADAQIARRRTWNKQVTQTFLPNGFSTSYPIYDGLPLFSASHTSASGVAVRSNIAAPVLALNSFNMEKGLMYLRGQLDPNGEPMEYEGGANGYFNAQQFPVASRIANADKMAQTNDNDPNVINGTLLTVNWMPHLSDSSTNWYLRARDDSEHGLRTLVWFTNRVIKLPADRQLQEAIVICSRFRPVVRRWEGTWASGALGA